MDIKVKSFKLNPKPNGSHDQHFPSLSIEEFTPITVQYLYLLLSWWAPTNCSCLHVKHAIKCLCCDRYTILMDLLLQLTKWQRLSWTRSRHFILCLLLLLLLDRVVSFTNWIIALPPRPPRCCANMRLPEVLPYSNWATTIFHTRGTQLDSPQTTKRIVGLPPSTTSLSARHLLRENLPLHSHLYLLIIS